MIAMFQKNDNVVFYCYGTETEIVPEYKMGTIKSIERIAYTPCYTYTVRDKSNKEWYVTESKMNTILSFILFLEAQIAEVSFRKEVVIETANEYEAFNINEQDGLGNTVLHMLSTLSDPLLVAAAIELGAENLRNNSGFTPYDIAKLYGFEETVKMLEPMCKIEKNKSVSSSDLNTLYSGLSSGNGYVREKSLELLNGTPEALPEILLRCNDWVKVIRNRALVIAIELIPCCDGQTLTRAISSLAKLDCSERRSSAAYEMLLKRFCDKANGILDVGLLSQFPKNVRKFAYKLFLGRNVLTLEDAVALYPIETDCFLKRDLLEYIYRIDAQIPDLCDDAILDKNPWIREAGLWCKYRKLNNSWSGVEKLLLDKCNRIQDGAIYILKHHSDIDLRDFFIQAALLEPSIPAIKGIEKCGDHNAAKVLLDYLPTLTGKRLAQALIAISVLLRNECEATYWEFLGHPSAGVRRSAMKALAKYCRPEPRQIYNKCVALENGPEVRQLIHMLVGANSWKRLTYVLKLYLSPQYAEYKKMLHAAILTTDMYGSMTEEEHAYTWHVLEDNLVQMDEYQLHRIMFALKHITIVD